MAVRAIRGATTADGNTREDIFKATQELISDIIDENGLDTADISDIIFTVTPDITAAFPAAAVRGMGITDVPLLDMAAPDVDKALAMCIRAMVHINTELKNSELRHIYLKGAKELRPDIANRKKISVAIDGPAGAGKSSVAKQAAGDMGYVYIDTGAMYRTVGVYGLENGIDVISSPADVVPELDKIKIDIRYEDGMQRMYLNGEDVSSRIRENDASMAASAVATVGEVRRRLVDMQREMARSGGVVMDGRDIGSVVLPDAELKIYLTASVHERAMRRWREYNEKGIECDFEELKRDVEERDRNDMSRAESPLVRVEDAVLLDSSDMSYDEVVAAVKSMIENAEKNR